MLRAPTSERALRKLLICLVGCLVGLLSLLQGCSREDATAKVTPSEPTRGTDPCGRIVPDTLLTIVNARFQGFRLPRESDSAPENAERTRQSGDSGCLLVTTGEFDGEEGRDLGVILIASPNGDRVRLIVARQRKENTWQVDQLTEWGRGPADLYLRRIPPGVYRATGDVAEDELEADARLSHESRHDGLEIGMAESSALGYFWDGERWLHVQLSD